MSEKKFANLHYPGMRPEPAREERPLSVEAKVFFETKGISEEQLRDRLARSVLVVASSTTEAVLRGLAASGAGRVGVLGELARGVNRAQLERAAREFPWVEFESFSRLDVDRTPSDVALGFDLIVVTPERSGLGSGVPTEVSLELSRPKVLLGEREDAWVLVYAPAEQRVCPRCHVDSLGLHGPTGSTIDESLMERLMILASTQLPRGQVAKDIMTRARGSRVVETELLGSCQCEKVSKQT